MEITVSPTITINNSDDGGGGGGGDCGCSTPPPWQDYPWPGGTQCYPAPQVPEQPPDTNPPTIPPTVPPSEWDAYRCKLANYAYEQILAWLIKVGEIPQSILTIGAILAFLWATLPAALLAIAGGAILELATLVWHWYALSEGLDEVAEYAVTWWTERREEIVCKFYNMTDVGATRGEIVGDFLEDLVVFAESRPWWYDEAINFLNEYVAKAMPFNIFLAPWRLVPPTGYVALTPCTCAGAGSGAISIEGDWWLVPIPQASYQNEVTDFVNAGTGVLTYSVPQWTMTPATANNYHEVIANVEDMAALISRMNDTYGENWPGKEIVSAHGHYVEFLSTWQSVMDNFGYNNEVGGAGGITPVFGTRVGTHNSTVLGSDAVYEAFHNGLDVSLPYGNAQMNEGKASFSLNTYNVENPLTLVCKVWLICLVE